MSISYIPCPVKLALACALILRGGAEFGNKGLYSKFAVIGDAVHLQSPALDTPARCKRGLMWEGFKCLPIFASSVFSALCQCKITLYAELKSAGAYSSFYFEFAYHFFKMQNRNICTPRTFLQVLINRTSKYTQLFCQWQTDFPNFPFFLFLWFFLSKSLWFPDNDLSR